MSDEQAKKQKILVIHGPNLNMLGHRDKTQYGTLTLDKLNKIIRQSALDNGFDISIYQFNSEEKIIKALHRSRKTFNGVIINPAAFTHYSYAIRDAIELLALPVVEVHLSDITKREDFRKISVTKDVCIRQFYGKKEKSYTDAVEFLREHLQSL